MCIFDDDTDDASDIPVEILSVHFMIYIRSTQVTKKNNHNVCRNIHMHKPTKKSQDQVVVIHELFYNHHGFYYYFSNFEKYN